MLIFKALILYSLPLLHGFHLSIMNIEQGPGSDTMKVSLRMNQEFFVTDYRLFDPEFQPGREQGNVIVPDERINRYFNENVKIYVNRKLLKGSLVSAVTDYYDLCLEFIFISDKDPLSIRIRNRIMTDLHDDQENMVYLEINNYHDALRLTSRHTEEKRKLRERREPGK
ncbi:MAG: hypothetical protein MUE74_10820 [Bacteroidales bacterium]|jgi:hypothetical protein|nr:hypothetical protein [Bacteroidales bacterium]